MECKNSIKLVGEIISPLEVEYKTGRQKFFKTFIKTLRTSGVPDVLQLSIPENAIIEPIKEGLIVNIFGRLSSRNEVVNKIVNEVKETKASKDVETDDSKPPKKKLVIFAFVNEINLLSADMDIPDENNVVIEGYICKEPTYRETPNKKQITDLFIASNGSHGKEYYIPTIAWGRNAKLTAAFEIGTKLKIEGRLQSRAYLKEGVEMIAYELSASTVERIFDAK